MAMTPAQAAILAEMEKAKLLAEVRADVERQRREFEDEANRARIKAIMGRPRV